MNIEENIADIDGSCRDINFPDVEKIKIESLLKYLESKFVLERATNSEGTELSIEELHSTLNNSDKQTIINHWKSDGLIKHFQFMFFWEENSKVFLELTFFPDELDGKLYNLYSFLYWLKPILVTLGIKEYYVRYENASWQYGDVSDGSGVIFTNIQHAING